MKIDECYRILEITPNASLDDIIIAYQDLKVVWNPTRFHESPPIRSKAVMKLNKINTAYNTLISQYQDNGEVKDEFQLNEHITDQIEKVAQALARITTEGGFLVLHADDEHNIYCQFAAKGGDPDIYAELVSNEYISPERRLSQQDILNLMNSGWSYDPGSNFCINWDLTESSVDLKQIAYKVIRPLVEIYGIPANSKFDIEIDLE